MAQDDSDVVRQGGVPPPAGEETPPTRAERIEQANRAAEEVGMPGIEIPEPPPPATDERQG